MELDNHQNIKLVCFDMDDTLIKQNSWYQLNLALGITDEEDQTLYQTYHQESITYEEWTDELLRLYKERGLATKEHIDNTLHDFVLADGAQTAISYLKERDYKLAVISGSFQLLTSAVAEKLGVDTKYAYGCTRFRFDENGYVSGISHDSDETSAKLRKLEEFCEHLQIPITQAACIGDGANDAQMFQATGHGITFADSPIVDIAWQTVHNLSELTEIL